MASQRQCRTSGCTNDRLPLFMYCAQCADILPLVMREQLQNDFTGPYNGYWHWNMGRLLRNLRLADRITSAPHRAQLDLIRPGGDTHAPG